MLKKISLLILLVIIGLYPLITNASEKIILTEKEVQLLEEMKETAESEEKIILLEKLIEKAERFVDETITGDSVPEYLQKIKNEGKIVDFEKNEYWIESEEDFEERYGSNLEKERYNYYYVTFKGYKIDKAWSLDPYFPNFEESGREDTYPYPYKTKKCREEDLINFFEKNWKIEKKEYELLYYQFCE